MVWGGITEQLPKPLSFNNGDSIFLLLQKPSVIAVEVIFIRDTSRAQHQELSYGELQMDLKLPKLWLTIRNHCQYTSEICVHMHTSVLDSVSSSSCRWFRSLSEFGLWYTNVLSHNQVKYLVYFDSSMTWLTITTHMGKEILIKAIFFKNQQIC